MYCLLREGQNSMQLHRAVSRTQMRVGVYALLTRNGFAPVPAHVPALPVAASLT